MSSYASITKTNPIPVQTPVVKQVSVSLPDELNNFIQILKQNTKAPDNLQKVMNNLRREMEESPTNFRGVSSNVNNNNGGGSRNFGPALDGVGWRNGGNSNSSVTKPFQSSPQVKITSIAPKYVSKFTSGEDVEDKIMNVIGNKLNSFTPKTYSDVRDFIYQILDSGETEFLKDFLDKVFSKATAEDLYCSLFAQLISEIGHKYPIMLEEMQRYHKEFLKIFDDVDESRSNIIEITKKRQYRIGYGQFLSELAKHNILEKSQLLDMVKKVMNEIVNLAQQEERVKVVEEFVDCLIRLSTNLSEGSKQFYDSVRKELKSSLTQDFKLLLDKKNNLPSLSSKARCGVLDLEELICDT
jgi:hypothetical protein